MRIDKRTIKTVIGVVTYNRRYYRNKSTKKYSYLLDESLNIHKYQRLGIVLESKILQFANLLSFENAGKLSMDFNEISKQTIKNIVKKYGKKKEKSFEDLPNKKVIKALYIEADEDHVSLQKQSKNNTINKLIYVHEGKLQESKNRNFLINIKIFASTIKSSDDMWIEVYDYIYSTYDMAKIEHIFILGDGARWIKTGLEWIENSKHVLDSFHLNKAILKISGGESREENKKLYEKFKKLIYSKEKKRFKLEAQQIIDNETKEATKNRKLQHMKYILNQWAGIVTNLDNKEKHQLGCSAEGHVSHILSSRMSSRPLSWSKDDLEGITKLRVSISNGATIDDLIKTMKTLIKISLSQ